MISFDVLCTNDHVFEGWFKDSATFDKLVKSGAVACPTCGDTKVRKALMAPRVAPSGEKSGKKSVSVPTLSGGEDGHSGEGAGAPSLAAHPGAEQRHMFMHAMREVRKYVESNCDYVGEKFPEEVRKIHRGESEHRNIYGEASEKEVRALEDEGIETGRVPWVPLEDS